jgi:hypothetical protein
VALLRLPQANASDMIRQCAEAADINLKNGGTLGKVLAMANHASTRTAELYDMRRDEISLDEDERILI